MATLMTIKNEKQKKQKKDFGCATSNCGRIGTR